MHRCAVRVAHENSAPPTLIPNSWCFTSFRSKLAAVTDLRADGPPRDLRLWGADGLELYYAPFDWANPEARIVLVGITPGAYQMRRALEVAVDLAPTNVPDDHVLAACKASASFSGPMRELLVAMLDEVGVAHGLGVASTASLWGADEALASFTSTICYPVFVNNHNYRGESPRIEQVPILREFAEHVLLADLALTPNALIVPLGKRPTEWVARLAEGGQIDAGRCLVGLPHPSPANGHRSRHFAERRDDLRRQVDAYARA